MFTFYVAIQSDSEGKCNDCGYATRFWLTIVVLAIFFTLVFALIPAQAPTLLVLVLVLVGLSACLTDYFRGHFDFYCLRCFSCCGATRAHSEAVDNSVMIVL